MNIAIVVAIARNGVIGRENGLPWRLPTDLRHFKAVTMGKPVIMGRKTWELIGKPLPGRTNIIVTRDDAYSAPGAEVVHSLDDALSLASGIAQNGDAVDEICVIGGGQIYAEALPLADRLHVTHVAADCEGDTLFPEIDPETWQAVDRESPQIGEKDSAAVEFVTYERRRSQD